MLAHLKFYSTQHALYAAELSQVVGRHRLQLHQYADDSQVNISVSLDDIAAAVYAVLPLASTT